MLREDIENVLRDRNSRFSVIHEQSIVQSTSAASRLILLTNCNRSYLPRRLSAWGTHSVAEEKEKDKETTLSTTPPPPPPSPSPFPFPCLSPYHSHVPSPYPILERKACSQADMFSTYEHVIFSRQIIFLALELNGKKMLSQIIVLERKIHYPNDFICLQTQYIRFVKIFSCTQFNLSVSSS